MIPMIPTMMMKMTPRFRLTAFTCALLLAPPVARAAPGSGPTATLRAYKERLDKLLKKKGEAPVDSEAVKELAAQLFDYRELARRSLAQHWDKLTADKQQEFTRTFSQMLEKNYARQLRSNLDYEVIYKNEAVTGEEATVASVIKARTRGKTTDVSIDYKMKREGERWRVYDIITDEVSMVRNYRAQFNKIITTESYDALLAKMRKRIADGDAAAKSPQ